jgi:cysteine-rich repeat protein
MAPTTGVCDDGNTLDGDGCSSSCTVENFYRCSGSSTTSASVCIYVGVPLNISLLKVKKTEGFNQGVFTFSISPPLLTIGQMDLSQAVNLTCHSQYTVSEVSYSSGVLRILADYSQDMEGVECLLTFNYDSTLV